MTFSDGTSSRAGLNVRPHVIEMLRELKKNNEIFLFTASHKEYANQVLDYLDPARSLFDDCFYRDSCILHRGMYMKDLRILGNRDLANVVLVDNAAYSFSMQVANGIPIIPFYKSKKDNELLDLLKYLKSLEKVKDVRPKIKDHFKLMELTKANSVYDGLVQLF